MKDTTKYAKILRGKGRKAERVVGRIRLYWSAGLRRWVSIPQD